MVVGPSSRQSSPLEGLHDEGRDLVAPGACNSERDPVYSDAMSDSSSEHDAGSTPNLRKSERTRQAILDGALEFLWSRPFREMTVAEKNDDGSVTVHFGGGPNAENYMPIMDGWLYLIRYYRPHQEILDGEWKMPAAVEIE